MERDSMSLILLICVVFTLTKPKEVHSEGQLNFGRKGYSPKGDHCQVQVGHQLVEKTCEGQTITFNVTVNSPDSRCSSKKSVPEGYVPLPGHGYYKYHLTPKPWNEARVTCKNEGGHLVVFNSETEAKFVAKLPNHKYDWALIGIHDFYKEGQWVTIFDEDLSAAGFDVWYPGEPTSLTADENCGVVFPNGLLGDYLCQIPHTFFCEIN